MKQLVSFKVDTENGKSVIQGINIIVPEPEVRANLQEKEEFLQICALACVRNDDQRCA